jgi:hypothetical protein
MKFLCVECDQPMIMQGPVDTEQEAITVIYACPGCERRMALVTNPEETQAVLSVGAEMVGGEEGKCTFLDVIQGSLASTTPEASSSGVGDPLVWTSEATARLERVPSFVRGMLKKSIEDLAREKGVTTVDDVLMDEASSTLGM